MSYVIKQDDSYLCWACGWTGNIDKATRYTDKSAAESFCRYINKWTLSPIEATVILEEAVRNDLP